MKLVCTVGSRSSAQVFSGGASHLVFSKLIRPFLRTHIKQPMSVVMCMGGNYYLYITARLNDSFYRKRLAATFCCRLYLSLYQPQRQHKSEKQLKETVHKNTSILIFGNEYMEIQNKANREKEDHIQIQLTKEYYLPRILQRSTVFTSTPKILTILVYFGFRFFWKLQQI